MIQKKNLNIILLLTGRMVSQFGFVLYITALPLHMLKLTNSLAAVGILLSVSSIPAVLITPFLGVWIERANRKYFMVACDILSGVSYVVILLGCLTKLLNPIILAIVVTVINLIYSVFDIASTMLFSEEANANSLERYNGIKSLIENGIAIIGPAAASVIYGMFGFCTIALIAAMSYFASAIQECFIQYQKKEQPIERHRYWKEMADGVAYICNKKDILIICILSMSLNFFLGNSDEVICPGILIHKYQIPAELFGLSSSAWVLGALLGSAFILKNKRLNLKENMHRLLILYAQIMIVVGVLSLFMTKHPYEYFIIFLFCQLLCSAVITCVNVPLWSYLQTNVELNYQGRFFSIQSFISNISTPLGIFYTGYLADLFGADWAYLLNSLCIIVIVLIHKPKLQT